MRISDFMAAILLMSTFSATPATAQICGANGQAACGGGCSWYLKGGAMPWCQVRPTFCNSGLDVVVRYDVGPDGSVITSKQCTPSSTVTPPPFASCDAACQAQKVNTALGTPEEASLNRSIRIDRSGAKISDATNIVLDIGGEGHRHPGSRCDLSASRVNVNPVTTDDAGNAIPNLVLAYGQKLPFVNAFADQVIAEASPFDAWWAEEMARVIKAGGKLAVCGSLGDARFESGVTQLSAHGLAPTATNYLALGDREVVFNIPPDYGYQEVAIPDPAKCPLPQPSKRTPRTGGFQATPCVLDMAVFYTKAALSEAQARTPPIDIQAKITERINWMNTSLANTDLPVKIRLVHSGPTDFDESEFNKDMEKVRDVFSRLESSNPTAANLAAIRRVQQARKAVGADLVSIFVTNLATKGGQGACGIGDDDLTETHGYSVLKWVCPTRTELALAHEAGHNLGLYHDRFAACQPSKGCNDPKTYLPDDYNRGYVSLQGDAFYTVMAYVNECVKAAKNCTEIPYYSNPLVKYNGVPTGSAVKPLSNNARAITENAPQVARYYPSAPPISSYAPNTNFAGILIGSSKSIFIPIYNTESISHRIVSVAFDNPQSDLSVGSTNAGRCIPGSPLDGARSCDVELVFAPQSAGKFETNLVVTTDAGNPTIVSIKGDALANVPELTLEAGKQPLSDTVGFGYVFVNNPAIVIPLKFYNSGPAALQVRKAELSSSTSFTLTQGQVQPCAGFPGAFNLGTSGWCDLQLSFLPTTTGSQQTTLTILSNDPATPQVTVTVTGVGVEREL